MLRLKDPILNDAPEPDGIELQPLHEPESLEMPSPYIPSTGATMMTSKELAGAHAGREVGGHGG